MVFGATVGGEWLAGKRLIEAVKRRYKSEVDFDVLSWKDMSRSMKTGKGSFGKNIWSDFGTVRKKISERLKSGHYEAIIVTDYLMLFSARWAARKRSITVDYWFHGIRSLPITQFSDINLRQVVLKILEVGAWVGAKRILVPSIEAEKYIQRRAWPAIGKDKFVRIPNIVPEAFFGSGVKPKIVSGKPVILYSGRLTRNKGLKELAAAVAILKSDWPQIVLVLACPTQDFDQELFLEMQNMVNSKGAKMRLMTDINERELNGWYRLADVTVLASKIEFAPLSILESMASGGICVGTKTGNIPELLGEIDERLILESGTADEIARGVKNVCQLPQSKKLEMRRQGQEIAGGFRASTAAEIFKRVYFETR